MTQSCDSSATGSSNTKVHVWSVSSGENLASLQASDTEDKETVVLHVRCNPKFNMIATASDKVVINYREYWSVFMCVCVSVIDVNKSCIKVLFKTFIYIDIVCVFVCVLYI